MSRFSIGLAVSLGVGMLIGIAGAAVAATPSTDLLRCERMIVKQTRSLAKQTVKKVHLCADRVVFCKLANEIDSEDSTECLNSATTLCNTVPPKVSETRTKARAKMLDKCGLIPIADVEAFIAGLGFLNVASECATLAPPLTPITVNVVDDLVDCLLATAQCSAESLVFLSDPRAQDSLTTAGIDASFPCVAP